MFEHVARIINAARNLKSACRLTIPPAVTLTFATEDDLARFKLALANDQSFLRGSQDDMMKFTKLESGACFGGVWFKCEVKQ